MTTESHDDPQSSNIFRAETLFTCLMMDFASATGGFASLLMVLNGPLHLGGGIIGSLIGQGPFWEYSRLLITSNQLSDFLLSAFATVDGPTPSFPASDWFRLNQTNLNGSRLPIVLIWGTLACFAPQKGGR